MAGRTGHNNIVPANDDRHRRFAPALSEDLAPRLAPPVTATWEQRAQQLADDPEFQAWARAEARARLAGR